MEKNNRKLRAMQRNCVNIVA